MLGGGYRYTVDFDLLKQELSNEIVEGTKERYRLEWPGKKESILTANLPTTKTLRPCREESENFDTTENLYIEGDNLEVLKILQESYLGKIKMIYIDPPYNTGKDFVYKDNFTKDANTELRESGQKDEEGNRRVKNLDSSGRYHSNWLSMMYPRLRLAKNLLTDDGVIFISIDDHEIHNLRKICDEIFGERNFVTQFIWEKTQHFGRQKINYYSNCDYILLYSKSSHELLNGQVVLKRFLVENIKSELEDAPLYNNSNPEKELKFKKNTVKFNIQDGIYKKSTNDKYKLLDTVVVKDGYNCNDFRIIFKSRWQQSTVDNEVDNGCLYLVKSTDFSIRVIYNNNRKSLNSPKQIIFTNNRNPMVTKTRFDVNIGTNENGTKELNQLLSGDNYFDYPKPASLINYFISILWDNKKNNFDTDCIVLDFFSGSSTTAHAVMKLNAEDGGKRKHIQVQLPAPTDEKSEAFKAGYKNICEIGKERIRRAAKKIKEETNADIDYGFRVYKLDSSNMKDVYYIPQDLIQSTVELLADNIKPDRSDEDLLTQIMLDWGLSLSSKIEIATIKGINFFKVSGNSLYACFDKNVTEEFIKDIAKDSPMYIIFKDSSFKKDSTKENIKQLLKQLSPETEMRVI